MAHGRAPWSWMRANCWQVRTAVRTGEKRVCFITAKREKQGAAMETLLEKIPATTPLICEAGGLHQYFKPALHIVTISKNKPPQKEIPGSADLVVEFDGVGFTPEVEVRWSGEGWSFL